MKNIFLALIILFAASEAKAEDNLNLYLGGFTKHFSERGNGKDYNDVHNNIGLEYESSIGRTAIGNFGKNNFWGVGAQYLKNSVDNDSTLITVNFEHRWDITHNWKISAGTMIGIQNGYPNSDRSKNEFVPVAYPTAEITYKRVGLYGTCVPKVYNSGFCFVGAKAKLASF